jgi:hypothetical protein
MHDIEDETFLIGHVHLPIFVHPHLFRVVLSKLTYKAGDFHPKLGMVIPFHGFRCGDVAFRP